MTVIQIDELPQSGLRQYSKIEQYSELRFFVFRWLVFRRSNKDSEHHSSDRLPAPHSPSNTFQRVQQILKPFWHTLAHLSVASRRFERRTIRIEIDDGTERETPALLPMRLLAPHCGHATIFTTRTKSPRSMSEDFSLDMRGVRCLDPR